MFFVDQHMFGTIFCLKTSTNHNSSVGAKQFYFPKYRNTHKILDQDDFMENLKGGDHLIAMNQ